MGTTTLDLGELERLRKAASPGTWWAGPHYKTEIHSRDRVLAQTSPMLSPQAIADAALIAAAINALPALIAAARERDALVTGLGQMEQERDAERTAREQAEQEAEKWRGAASVLCGAHVGVPQASCPVCRAEQAEAKLAEVEARLETERREWWRRRDVDEPCETCHGAGSLTYANTSTWRGGVGGNAMRRGVCDQCWGSGEKGQPWMSHREAEAKLAAAEAREVGLRAVLTELEWHDNDCCLDCGQRQADGHERDCHLDAALRRQP